MEHRPRMPLGFGQQSGQPLTILNLGVRQSAIFILQQHAHSTRIRPVLRVKLLRFQSSLQSEHLHGVHNVTSQWVFHRQLRAHFPALGARTGLVEIDRVEALEILGNFILGLGHGHLRHLWHLLGHRRRFRCGGGGNHRVAGRAVRGGDLIGVRVRQFLDSGVVRHGEVVDGGVGERRKCGPWRSSVRAESAIGQLSFVHINEHFCQQTISFWIESLDL